MSETASTCPYDLWDEEVVYPGKWMSVRRIKFRLKGSKTEGVWETTHRATNPDAKGANCIGIVAILKKDGKKYFVLVKQYRIPCKSWSIEFPAGHIEDSDADIFEAGLRELREETGYTPTKMLGWSDGRQFLDKALVDESFRFLFVEIDGDAEVNKNPKQDLDEAEHLEVLLVECDKLLEFLDEANKTDGVEVLACLYSFALGYNMANKLNI